MLASVLVRNVTFDTVLPMHSVITFSSNKTPLPPSLHPPMQVFHYIMTSCTCDIINMTGGAVDHQCKPQQLAPKRQMSEESKLGRFLPTCPRETGPGDASAQHRNSKFWHNVPNEYLGKVTKFRVATSNGFLWRAEKLPGGGADSAPPPPVIGLKEKVGM